MNGTDYVAKVRLSTKSNETLALPGDRCDRVNPTSLPWLVEQGLIEWQPTPRGTLTVPVGGVTLAADDSDSDA